MKLDRRNFCMLGAGALAMLSTSRSGWAATSEYDAAVADFLAGAEAKTGTITLGAPEIAENGNTVPVNVSVESPMTEDDYVTEVIILASDNPLPGIATFKFTPMSGEASASTRIRLAKTQDVIAMARTSTGAVFMDQKTIKVTIGGCGG